MDPVVRRVLDVLHPATTTTSHTSWATAPLRDQDDDDTFSTPSSTVEHILDTGTIESVNAASCGAASGAKETLAYRGLDSGNTALALISLISIILNLAMLYGFRHTIRKNTLQWMTDSVAEIHYYLDPAVESKLKGKDAGSGPVTRK